MVHLRSIELHYLLTFNRSYHLNGDLCNAADMTSLNFNRAEHSLLKIHTHVTSQGFIFINFDSSPTPSITFTDQFGEDFDPTPTSTAGKVTGDEYALFHKSGWEYDHTWESSAFGTNFNWKTFADGFQECYHCRIAHPSTLAKDFSLHELYIRTGTGASRVYLPPLTDDAPLEDDATVSHVTWLYPMGFIIFSTSFLMIGRCDARDTTDTRYQSETYRRADLKASGEEYQQWMKNDIEYSRIIEIEDVELCIRTQRGYKNRLFEKGKLHPVQGKLSGLS